MHKSAWEGEYNLRPFFVLLSANLFSLFPPQMALLLDGYVLPEKSSIGVLAVTRSGENTFKSQRDKKGEERKK